MKLYILERTDDWEYDEFSEVIVRAESPEQAVTLAFETDEDLPDWWTGPRHRLHGFREDGSNFTVKELPAEGEPGVILASYHAG